MKRILWIGWAITVLLGVAVSLVGIWPLYVAVAVLFAVQFLIRKVPSSTALVLVMNGSAILIGSAIGIAIRAVEAEQEIPFLRVGAWVLLGVFLTVVFSKMAMIVEGRRGEE